MGYASLCRSFPTAKSISAGETQNGGVEDGPAHWRAAIAEALASC